MPWRRCGLSSAGMASVCRRDTTARSPAKRVLRTPSEEEKKALASEFQLDLLTHHDDLPLEEQISLVPPEVLEREIWAAIADSSALGSVSS
jgi:hypothetical protein